MASNAGGNQQGGGEKPSDFLNQDDDGDYYIDFTSYTWQKLLRRWILSGQNVANRNAAIQGRTANQRVYVNKLWLDKRTFADFMTTPHFAQSILIAAYGEKSRTPCEDSISAKDRKSNSGKTAPRSTLPFQAHWQISGHFSSSCANCASQSYYGRCSLNRTLPILSAAGHPVKLS
jgi:hypothetical protein